MSDPMKTAGRRSEAVGKVTSSLPTTALGTLLGGVGGLGLGDKISESFFRGQKQLPTDAQNKATIKLIGGAGGAGAGALAGHYLPRILGASLAESTKPRSVEEVAEHDDDYLKNLIIPGLASYNAAKRKQWATEGKEITEAKARRRAQQAAPEPTKQPASLLESKV